MDKREAIERALEYFAKPNTVKEAWEYTDATKEQIVAGLREALEASRSECHDAAERGQGCFRALTAERELAALRSQPSATVPPNDGKSHINHPLQHFDRTCLACWWEADEESVP